MKKVSVAIGLTIALSYEPLAHCRNGGSLKCLKVFPRTMLN